MESGKYSCVTLAVGKCLCRGTVRLEGRGAALLGEAMVKGAEPSLPVPPQPDLECDR